MAHPNFKHGKYSDALRGILTSALRGSEIRDRQVTLQDEVDVSYALIRHEMDVVAQATPAPELWARARALIVEARRLRGTGRRQEMARKLVELEELLLTETPPSTDRLTAKLEAHRKLVDTEERRKDRARVSVSVETLIGMVEAMVTSVNRHVTSDAERAAIGHDFDALITRASWPELTDAAGGQVH